MVAMINTESNVAGEMGPEPLLEPPDWDTHSMESRYTEESKVGFDTQVNIIVLTITLVFYNVFKLYQGQIFSTIRDVLIDFRIVCFF